MLASMHPGHLKTACDIIERDRKRWEELKQWAFYIQGMTGLKPEHVKQAIEAAEKRFP